MNVLKKVYCRVFQTAFRLAIPLLPYRTPKILHTVSEVPELLHTKNIQQVLIVTDPMIYAAGLTKTLEQALKNRNVSYTIYEKTVANPTTANVEEAKQLYIDRKCQALIGFGGGSSIDCAKIVGARVAKPRKSVAKMKGILQIRKKIPLLIAVPTTAGTGSETTLAAVITDSEPRHKFPINDFSLIPPYAVLDPNLTRTLPPALTASTGMDALTHAVEAYIGRSTTRETRAFAIQAVQLIFGNIEKAFRNGEDMDARENMLNAAFLAGAAFTKSYVGYCHAVAHSLGGKYNIPHGLANAVLLPVTLEAYGDSVYKKLKELAVAAGLCQETMDEKTAAEAFIRKIKDLNRAMNIPETLPNIQSADIPALARCADREANPLYPVPRFMDAEQLQSLYYAVQGDVRHAGNRNSNTGRKTA